MHVDQFLFTGFLAELSELKVEGFASSLSPGFLVLTELSF